MDWAIKFTYVMASILCVSAALSSRTRSFGESASKYTYFWGVIAIVMLILCVNKLYHLDLRVYLWAKEMAKSDGWYSERRPCKRPSWEQSPQGVFSCCSCFLGFAKGQFESIGWLSWE